jgi:CBS domain-containing protein
VSPERARDAMVAEPRAYDVEEKVQEAGKALARPEVRAVLVCSGGRLVGVVTRKTLVRRVVAEGLDPITTRLGDIAEEPYLTIDADMPLEDAFRLLEERDFERVPVVDGGGELLGILSRGVVRRRLAEDEPPGEDAAEEQREPTDGSLRDASA